MSNIWFCSDLHWGHKNIDKLREPCGVASEQDNREKIQKDWIKCVRKNDDVYVLGDAAFTEATVHDFGGLPGRKFLVRGNHDKLDTQTYLKYFEHVYGILKYKEFWLTHAPIHTSELRGKVNLHGHVHFDTVTLPWEEFDDDTPIADSRYFNCCPENLWPTFGSALVSLEQIRTHLKSP